MQAQNYIIKPYSQQDQAFFEQKQKRSKSNHKYSHQKNNQEIKSKLPKINIFEDNQHENTKQISKSKSTSNFNNSNVLNSDIRKRNNSNLDNKSPLNIDFSQLSQKKNSQKLTQNFSSDKFINDNMEQIKEKILLKEKEILILKQKANFLEEQSYTQLKNNKAEFGNTINKMEINLINLQQNRKYLKKQISKFTNSYNKQESSQKEKLQNIKKEFDENISKNYERMKMEIKYRYNNKDQEVIKFLQS